MVAGCYLGRLGIVGFKEVSGPSAARSLRKVTEPDVEEDGFTGRVRTRPYSFEASWFHSKRLDVEWSRATVFRLLAASRGHLNRGLAPNILCRNDI